jgi:hypothetical protein
MGEIIDDHSCEEFINGPAGIDEERSIPIRRNCDYESFGRTCVKYQFRKTSHMATLYSDGRGKRHSFGNFFTGISTHGAPNTLRFRVRFGALHGMADLDRKWI